MLFAPSTQDPRDRRPVDLCLQGIWTLQNAALNVDFAYEGLCGDNDGEPNAKGACYKKQKART
jgi:hypothetical protein